MLKYSKITKPHENKLEILTSIEISAEERNFLIYVFNTGFVKRHELTDNDQKIANDLFSIGLLNDDPTAFNITYKITDLGNKLVN